MSIIDKDMSWLRLTYKFPAAVGLLLAYGLACLCVAVFVTQIDQRRTLVLRLGRILARWWLWVLNVEVTHKLASPLSQKQRLIVANHVSYLDIPIIFTLQPCLFITSIEVYLTPVIGHFCRLSSCLFVERRKKTNIKSQVAALQDVFASGFSIGLFPEGTSTNGSSILPFKRSLLEAAIASQVEVLPLCINYLAINGQKVDPTNRDLVCWYGSMDFFPHFIRLLSLRTIRVELCMSEPIAFSESIDRKVAASHAQGMIAAMHVATC